MIKRSGILGAILSGGLAVGTSIAFFARRAEGE